MLLISVLQFFLSVTRSHAMPDVEVLNRPSGEGGDNLQGDYESDDKRIKTDISSSHHIVGDYFPITAYSQVFSSLL